MSDNANETGASQEDIVTDDDLRRAAAEANKLDEKEPDVEPDVEPVVEDELEPEPEPDDPDEPDDPSERSALGRKVAEQGEAVSALGEQLSRMEQMLGQIPVPKDDELVVEEDADEPQEFTKREVREMIQSEKTLDTDARDSFETDIAKQASLAKDNDEMFDKVCDEISANFMPKDFRKASAELIYAKAKIVVLSKLTAQPLDTRKNPVKGEEPRSALGNLPEEKIPTKEVSEVEFSDDVKKGIEGLGISETEAKEMLSEDDSPGILPSKTNI